MAIALSPLPTRMTAIIKCVLVMRISFVLFKKISQHKNQYIRWWTTKSEIYRVNWCISLLSALRNNSNIYIKIKFLQISVFYVYICNKYIVRRLQCLQSSLEHQNNR